MNGTTVELDLGYFLTMAQGYSGSWVFWLVSYLVLSSVWGLFVVRGLVSEKLEDRRNGNEACTDMPAELLGVGGFLSSPIWFPFYLLWFVVSYPNDKEKSEKSEK